MGAEKRFSHRPALKELIRDPNPPMLPVPSGRETLDLTIFDLLSVV
jgi:hypothetical protein